MEESKSSYNFPLYSVENCVNCLIYVLIYTYIFTQLETHATCSSNTYV